MRTRDAGGEPATQAGVAPVEVTVTTSTWPVPVDPSADALHVAAWDQELGELLSTLSAVQHDLLAVLTEKQKRLTRPEAGALAEIQEREAELIARLEAVHLRRRELLERAGQEGLPAQSLAALTAALPDEERRQLAPQIDQASARASLLQHHSLTNWVVVQRTLLHLSHLLEIIATGGRMQPTYGTEAAAPRSGGLVDQAA